MAERQSKKEVPQVPNPAELFDQATQLFEYLELADGFRPQAIGLNAFRRLGLSEAYGPLNAMVNNPDADGVGVIIDKDTYFLNPYLLVCSQGSPYMMRIVHDTNGTQFYILHAQRSPKDPQQTIYKTRAMIFDLDEGQVSEGLIQKLERKFRQAIGDHKFLGHANNTFYHRLRTASGDENFGFFLIGNYLFARLVDEPPRHLQSPVASSPLQLSDLDFSPDF